VLHRFGGRKLRDRLLKKEYQEMDIFEATTRIKEIARQIKLSELLYPTSKEIELVAELLYRVENIDIQPIDMSSGVA